MNTLTKKEAIKQNWGNFFIYLAICIGCVVGHFFIKSDWKYALLFLGAVALWLAISGLIKGFQKINRSFCPSCGAYLDYENYDVTWRSKGAESYVNGNKAYAVVHFEITCPDCGHFTAFTKHLAWATYDKDTNTWEEQDVHDLAQDLFWTRKD